mmetsp:Transcript_2421/g.8152  ORF Transcript_2421/g.8152 Transcript_2421/m.8152 type:complete len:255 (-) Transcript_2421:19-783(-)
MPGENPHHQNSLQQTQDGDRPPRVCLLVDLQLADVEVNVSEAGGEDGPKCETEGLAKARDHGDDLRPVVLANLLCDVLVDGVDGGSTAAHEPADNQQLDLVGDLRQCVEQGADLHADQLKVHRPGEALGKQPAVHGVHEGASEGSCAHHVSLEVVWRVERLGILPRRGDHHCIKERGERDLEERDQQDALRDSPVVLVNVARIARIDLQGGGGRPEASAAASLRRLRSVHGGAHFRAFGGAMSLPRPPRPLRCP